jgi:hypothetical protein
VSARAARFDISNNLQGSGTTLDGGDGDDRIAARAWDTSSASFATTPASVACGAGADIVFTNAAAPADCERVNDLEAAEARPVVARQAPARTDPSHQALTSLSPQITWRDGAQAAEARADDARRRRLPGRLG